MANLYENIPFNVKDKDVLHVTLGYKVLNSPTLHKTTFSYTAKTGSVSAESVSSWFAEIANTILDTTLNILGSNVKLSYIELKNITPNSSGECLSYKLPFISTFGAAISKSDPHLAMLIELITSGAQSLRFYLKAPALAYTRPSLTPELVSKIHQFEQLFIVPLQFFSKNVVLTYTHSTNRPVFNASLKTIAEFGVSKTKPKTNPKTSPTKAKPRKKPVKKKQLVTA